MYSSVLQAIPRRRHLHILQDYCANLRTNRILLLSGPSGVGKTSFLNEAAATLRKERSNVVVEVDARDAGKEYDPFSQFLRVFQRSLIDNASPALDSEKGKERVSGLLWNLITKQGRYGVDYELPTFLKQYGRFVKNELFEKLARSYQKDPEELFHQFLSIGHVQSGTAESPSVRDMLYGSLQLLRYRETRRGEGRASGLETVPFALDLLNSLHVPAEKDLSETTADPNIQQVVKSISEDFIQRPVVIMQNVDQLEKEASGRRLLDEIFLRYHNTTTPTQVPLIMSTNSVYHVHHVMPELSERRLFKHAEMPGFAQRDVNFAYVPGVWSQDDMDRIFDQLGGNPTDLVKFKQYQDENPTTVPLGQLLQEYLDTKVYPVEFQLLLQNFFASPTALAELDRDKRFRWRVLSFFQQFAKAKMVLNYTEPLGTEILECPIVQGLLHSGILYQQGSPRYIRPHSRAIESCIKRYVRDRLQQMKLAERVLYTAWHTVSGYMHLNHLYYRSMYDNAPEFSESH